MEGHVEIKDLIIIFTSIFYEALPFIVLGSLISGVLEHLVPQQWLTWLIPRNRPLAIALGCLLGLIFPMCECGIVPVMRRLLRKGVPLSCCVAYMMAGPIINFVVILSTAVAFGNYPTWWAPVNIGFVSFSIPVSILSLRIGMGFMVAFTTALVMERLDRKHGYDLLVDAARPDRGGKEQNNNQRTGVFGKIGGIAETALHDFVDITVFLTLGSILSAISRYFISQRDIESLSTAFPALAILAMMGLAILLCLCSEADAFVAASFSTLPVAPKIAFLVLGPMLDIKLYLLFTRVFRRRTIWTLITCIVVQVFVYSMIVHFVVPRWVGSDLPVGQ